MYRKYLFIPLTFENKQHYNIYIGRGEEKGEEEAGEEEEEKNGSNSI